MTEGCNGIFYNIWLHASLAAKLMYSILGWSLNILKSFLMLMSINVS